MGENIGRNVAFVAIFLTSFALIIGMIPNSFQIPTQPNYERLSEPEFSWYNLELGLDEGQYPLWGNGTLNWNDGGAEELNVGTMEITAYFNAWYRDEGEISIARVDTVFFFFHVMDYFKLGNHEGIYYDDIFDNIKNANISSFVMKDSKYTYHISLSYNATKFNDFNEAWHGTSDYSAEFYLFIGMTISDADTVFKEASNAWALISQILFFQRPDIHPVMNAFLAIPLWVSVAYLSVRIILWIISAPLGGGGS